jgi:hypothetical protein
MNALVQPLQSKHLENILVAKSLVDPSRGYVPIRLAYQEYTCGYVENHSQLLLVHQCQQQ